MDGKTWSVPADRGVVLDIVQYALKVPSFPVERHVLLSALSKARGQSARRISWTAIFTRAYGLASRRHPELRQVYVSWPWPRLYQSPICVISIAVNRTVPAGERLYFGQVHSPDSRSLSAIQEDLDGFQTGEISKVFRIQAMASKVPSWVRRLGWWWRMEWDYKNRPRRAGTGGISSLAGQGVTNRLHPCIMTSSLSFGPLGNDEHSLVTLQCDHRVMDGTTAARALNSLCDFLVGQVFEELCQLQVGNLQEPG